MGANGCGIEAPLQLSGVVLPDGAHVTLAPAATIRCDFAERVADWVRDDLAPLFAHRNSKLVGIANADSYDCRGRNRVAGAKLSEHGTGNAIDVRALEFADGSKADITRVAAEMTVFAQLKLTACTRFSTVLGPGSDGYHEDNLHLDAAYRRNGAHFCRWRLPS